ncbi:MAG: flippase-like domain-containing protein [Acidiferrobacterales bacterium]|nr:flippase-like domain-containing protein [Acidiferrobacterales bacterium]
MKNLLRIALSIGVSFAILAFLLNMVNAGVPDDQRPSIFATLQATSISLVIIALFIYLIGLLARAYRYRLLIAMGGEQNLPSFSQMVLVTGVRNMVVDMLPARIGELGYVALLNRGYGVKLQHCMSSLTVAVALDFVALLIVVFLVVLKQGLGIGSAAGLEGWAIGALLMAIVLVVVALVGLFVITPLVSRWLNSYFHNSIEKNSVFGKLLTLLSEFSQSLLLVRQGGQTSKLILLSFVIRVLKYLGLYLLFRAVAVPSFEALAELPVEQVISALIGGEIGASLPIPTFMSFGAYEAGSAFVFQLLGVGEQASVVVTMLCVHIWSQFMEYLIGALFLVSFILLNRRAKSLSSPSSPRKLAVLASFVFAGLVLVAGSFTFAYQLWAASKLGSLSAPDAGEVSADAEQWRELSRQHVSSLDGFVVFSSNRDGNHDIFKLNLADFELTKLTENPNTETYPRISPDGTKLVFARGHEEWVSQRNSVAWDVYVLDMNSKQQIKVGENGTAPQWLNNSEITYLQETNKIVKVNVSSLASAIIYETGVNNAMPQGAAIQNPEYSPVLDQFVFTGRQSHIGLSTGHWGTAITRGSDHQGVLNGCELAWNHSGTDLFQVAPGGRDNDLQIVSVDPVTLESSQLIDLEGEFSHEYWPKDSSNGEYMVFGASRSPKEHEHDVADYEIFLWKVGSDASKATRLTFHTGNDNWPDVFIAD